MQRGSFKMQVRRLRVHVGLHNEETGFLGFIQLGMRHHNEIPPFSSDSI